MKIKRIRNYLMLLVAWFILGTSCSGFLDQEVEPEAFGDAMIRVYQQGDSLVYSRVFYTYSSSPMDSVKVRAKSTDEIIELDTINGKYTYAYLPELSAYTSTLPDDDAYYFDVTFSDGKTTTASDYLYDDYLEPAQFISFAWDSVSNKANLKWEADENTQFNKILLIDSENTIVFETDLIENYYTEMSITNYSFGWIDSYNPDEGEELKIMIISYLYEYGMSSFDVQCLAVNDLYILNWGTGIEILE